MKINAIAIALALISAVPAIANEDKTVSSSAERAAPPVSTDQPAAHPTMQQPTTAQAEHPAQSAQAGLTPAQQAQFQSAAALAQSKLAQIHQQYRDTQRAQLEAANGKVTAAFSNLQNLEATLEASSKYKSTMSELTEIAGQYAAATPTTRATLQARATTLQQQLQQARLVFEKSPTNAPVASVRLQTGILTSSEASAFKQILGPSKPVLTALFLSSSVTPGTALIVTGENLGTDGTTCGSMTVTINGHTWPVQGVQCTGGVFVAGVMAQPGSPSSDDPSVLLTGLVDQPATISYLTADNGAATLKVPFYALRTVTELTPQEVQVFPYGPMPIDGRPQLTFGTYHNGGNAPGYQGADLVYVPLINGWTLYQIDLHADWWGNGCYGAFGNITTGPSGNTTAIKINFTIPPTPNFPTPNTTSSMISPICGAGVCDTCDNWRFVYEAGIYVEGPEGTAPEAGAPAQGPDQLPGGLPCLDELSATPEWPWYGCTVAINNF